MANPHDQPRQETYMFCALAFGATGSTRVIVGPKGMFGKVRKVLAMVTTSFVGTSTAAKVQIGDGTTANKFAEIAMGAANAGTAAGANVVAQNYAEGLLGEATIPHKYIQPDAAATTITFAAATGGSIAGVADVQIVIDWFTA